MIAKKRISRFSLLSLLFGTAIVAIIFAIISRPKGFPDLPVNPNAPPIIYAAQRGDSSAVREIVSSNPNAIFTTDAYGNTAANSAIQHYHPEIAIYLIGNGYPIDPQTPDEFPLIMSCLSCLDPGSTQMLKYLLENGADPNIIYEPEGWIPLNMAVNNGKEEDVKLLLQHGAIFDSRDRHGITSLEKAEARLIEYRNPNSRTSRGMNYFDRRRGIAKWERMIKILNANQTSQITKR